MPREVTAEVVLILLQNFPPRPVLVSAAKQRPGQHDLDEGVAPDRRVLLRHARLPSRLNRGDGMARHAGLGQKLRQRAGGGLSASY